MKKTLAIISVLGIAVAACDGSNDGVLPDVPGIDPASASVTDEVTPCDPISVVFDVPAYDHNLNAGVSIGDDDFCEQQYVPTGSAQ
ncbi:MAG: hypothetical protein KJ574_00170, partial [Nanoarchaeota archaeon]|nr:hypothetical protein [Nanoarchaeota archaeon]